MSQPTSPGDPRPALGPQNRRTGAAQAALRACGSGLTLGARQWVQGSLACSPRELCALLMALPSLYSVPRFSRHFEGEVPRIGGGL